MKNKINSNQIVNSQSINLRIHLRKENFKGKTFAIIPNGRLNSISIGKRANHFMMPFYSENKINHTNSPFNMQYNMQFKNYMSTLSKQNLNNVVMKEKRDTDKLINLLMIDGKKSVASRLVFDALFILKRKYLSNAAYASSPIKSDSTQEKIQEKDSVSVLQVLSTAIDNVTPSVEVRKVRRAGNTFLIPAILSQHKANTLAMRWIIDSARKKQQGSNLNFSECLADEIFQAYSKQGKARQKRDELHSVATSNRANIRFRWW